MIYGYARCSTSEDKQDLQRQIRELRAAGAEDVRAEFEHGDSVLKLELDVLLRQVQPGDTIITAEVSRLSRSTKQLCGLIDLIKEKRICLQILNSVTIDCRSGNLDPMTKAFLQMAGVFSELELSMTRERVRSGMANARAKGVRLGRPLMTADDLPPELYRHYPLYVSKKINKVEFARLVNVSRPTLDKYLHMMGQ